MGDVLRLVSGQSTLWFGGDYNPEQWPEHVRAADLAALEQLGVNIVTLPVFAWALLHPSKDRFELDWLDRVVDDVAGHGIGLVLATPTAAQPPWMSLAYPEILPVDSDGTRRRHGGRVNYCPTSTPYREESARVAHVLAERFADHPALRLWHVNNEYGPVCFCDWCRDAFREWVGDRYGDLAAVNEAWGTNVWGNTLTDWAEIELPSARNAMGRTVHGRVRFAANPSLALDHARFCSAVLLDCFLNEKAAIREHSPDVPITTNFHGPVQTVDWHEWAPHLDLVSWDSYPRAGDHWAHAAFGHDLARGAGRRPELLVMEAAPGPVNWHDRNPLKRPGRVRLEALQAVARGGRGVLYFQVRQARAGIELHHSALIPRHGRLDTRTGAELAHLGAELSALGVPPNTHRLTALVAVVFDWPSWWAHHNTPGLDQRSRYLDTVRETHRALTERGLVVDVRAAHGPFAGYDVVVAPLLHLVSESAVVALAGYVRDGGRLVTTAGSGIVGDGGQVHPEGSDPRWRELLGMWVEETDVQPPDVVNLVVFADDGSTAEARHLFDIVRTESATVIAEFADDFYAGSPAVTTNLHGEGEAVYVASPTAEVVADVVGRFVPLDRPGDVERVVWRGAGDELAFVLNHGEQDATVALDEGPWTDVQRGGEHSREVRVAARDAVMVRRAT